MPLLQIFNVANMSYSVIHENKTLTKNPEFTVCYLISSQSSGEMSLLLWIYG